MCLMCPVEGQGMCTSVFSSVLYICMLLEFINSLSLFKGEKKYECQEFYPFIMNLERFVYKSM